MLKVAQPVRLVLRALLAVGLVASTAGCLLPGDPSYALGVARIGDSFHVFAPLCADERIASVKAYDNQAADKTPETGSGRPTIPAYWQVAEPQSEAAAKGEFVIGEDAPFGQVLVPVPGQSSLPAITAVELTVRKGDRLHVVADVFGLKGVPEYPAGTDPETVKYVYNEGATSEELLTQSQISEESMCAFNYVA
ncbi:hypothetical protein AB0J68_06580 [Micromonospora sp. NPDC049580]|uniref:hypothetical protein n=1 Tax=Micromonospora sp. NPDC049580 TaxID=3154832 RepID=UPI0034161C57